MGRFFSWVVLVLWVTFLVGMQLAVAHRVRPVGGPLEWWLFDLSLVALVVVAVRLPKERIWVAAALLSLVRLAHTTDPPVVVFAAYGWAAYFLRWVKSMVDPSAFLIRAVLALLVLASATVFAEVVAVLRTPIAVRPGLDWDLMGMFVARALPAALVAAGLVALMGRAMSGLPGLGSLYKTRAF